MTQYKIDDLESSSITASALNLKAKTKDQGIMGFIQAKNVQHRKYATKQYEPGLFLTLNHLKIPVNEGGGGSKTRCGGYRQ